MTTLLLRADEEAERTEAMMRLNPWGLGFAAVYAVFAIAMFVWMLSAQGYPKGQIAIGQLAVMPTILLADAFRLGEWMLAHPWINNYPAMFLLNLVLFYGIGSAIHWIGRMAAPR